MKLLILLMLTWNLHTFLFMGIDKYKAKHDKQRISEKNLIMCAMLMGGAGVALGMWAFHHKTKKIKFQILVPVAMIVNAAVIYGLFYYNIVCNLSRISLK